MFYYGTNIVFDTMISVYFVTGRIYWLATVQGFGILTGGVLLWVSHFRDPMLVEICTNYN